MRTITRTIAAIAAAAVVTVGAVGFTTTTAAAEDRQTAGTCKTFVGRVTVHACVPTYSPNGGHVVRVFEDSSATYTDGWVMDGDTAVFRR